MRTTQQPSNLNQKARDLRRSYRKPPCERERAALGLAVGGLDRKARDLRRSYKMLPCIRELPRQRRLGEPTETDRAKQTHLRLDLAVGATQVASLSTRPTTPLPPYRPLPPKKPLQPPAPQRSLVIPIIFSFTAST